MRPADFGRLSGIAALGIDTDVSTLERLVLAEARCHHVVIKVVAYGDETDRQRLHGHSIVCPHAVEAVPTEAKRKRCTACGEEGHTAAARRCPKHPSRSSASGPPP